MKKAVMLCIWVIAAGVFTCGCFAPPRLGEGDTAYIRVLSGMRSSLQGTTVLNSDIPGALKKMGADRRTGIEISLEGKINPKAVESLVRKITKAGFRNVFVTAVIRVSGDGVIHVAGRKTSLAKTGCALRSVGAGGNTRIEMVCAGNADMGTVQRIMREVIRSGFPRVVLRRKKQPTAKIIKKP